MGSFSMKKKHQCREEKMPLINSSNASSASSLLSDTDRSDSDHLYVSDSDTFISQSWSEKSIENATKSRSNSSSNSTKKEEGMTSNLQTMMHLLKGNIGTGILAMPNAFGQSGLILGTILLPVIGGIAVHCMQMLVVAHNRLHQKLASGFLSYEEVTKQAFANGPKPLRKFASLGQGMVILFLMITQLGFCCAYVLFVAETMSSVVSSLTQGKIAWSLHTWMLIELPVMILYCSIRNLKTLSIFSALANLLQSVGILLIFFNLMQDLPPSWERPAVGPVEKLPLYFGIVVYAFEGIGIVLPLQKEMREPKSFVGMFGVLNTGMILVGALYLAMGFFGYLKFGEEVMRYGSITLNLSKSPMNETIKLMFALAIFFTFALQFYVPVRILWPQISSYYKMDLSSNRTLFLELLFRAILTTITFLIAAAIPKLDLFISLVGALSSSALALILPPIIDLLTCWPDTEISAKKWSLLCVKNIFIVLFGLIGFATGTYISIKNIIHELS